ncbi:MAG: hypothetical protein ACI38B_02895 [Bifidobacterium sp.]|uniref:hypothetical protein n=1 Tax=Bifidobacterium sp. TaxID=41200 RepID=UPI003EFCAE6C
MNADTLRIPGDGLTSANAGAPVAHTKPADTSAVNTGVPDSGVSDISVSDAADDTVPPALESRYPQLRGWPQMDDAQRIEALGGVLTGLQHALDEGTARR